MNAFDSTPHGFAGLRSLEAVMEVGLAIAALAFTAAIWLADGTQPTMGQSVDVTHVTFPTVHVVGSGR